MQTIGSVYSYVCTFLDSEGKQYFEAVRIHAGSREESERKLLSLVPIESKFVEEGK